jgi:hypothetical protein
VGGALGLAVLATLSATRSDTLLASGSSPDAALTGGFHLAFWVGAGLVTAAFAITTLVIRTQPVVQEAERLEEIEPEPEGEPAYWEAA